MIGTRCLDTCKRPTPAQAHCSICHLTWGGVSGFDQHRSFGVCLNPRNLGQMERDGVWRTPMEEGVAEKLRAAREQRGKSDDPALQ